MSSAPTETSVAPPLHRPGRQERLGPPAPAALERVGTDLEHVGAACTQGVERGCSSASGHVGIGGQLGAGGWAAVAAGGSGGGGPSPVARRGQPRLSGRSIV